MDSDSAKIRRRMGMPTTDVPSSLLDLKHGSPPNENNDLVSPTPDHNYESQVAETHVHVVKRDLRRKAASSDLPTQYPDSSPRREPRSGPTTMIDFDVSSVTTILMICLIF